MAENNVLIEVYGLKTYFYTDEGVVKAVDGVDLTIKQGTTLCVVGESGCGKSVTAFSILQVVSKPGRIVEGSILLHRPTGSDAAETIDLARLPPRGREIRSIRGRDIGMIFQEPMTSLSPVHTIGNQIIEAMLLHLKLDKAEARERAVEILSRVGIPEPEERLDAYTFQLSGGMRQRAMIAAALSCEPSLLIADEPTTALDVTTQANILDLIAELQKAYGMAVMFITHNLGVVAEIADEVAVMYLGRVVEYAEVDTIFHDTRHPYARALLYSIPTLGEGTRLWLQGQKEIPRRYSIRGMVPHPFARPGGCVFHPRCDDFIPGVCDVAEPPITQLPTARPGAVHTVRCWLYEDHPGELHGKENVS
jgi:peptide/nickel transport system ATP-binding protein